MRKYLKLMHLVLSRNMAYRGRVIIWTFVDVSSFVIFPFIWLAIYGDAQSIEGFTRQDIVTYYLVMAIISFAASSHQARFIRDDIAKGDLNQFLLKPFPYPLYIFFTELSYKFFQLFLSLPLIIGAFALFPQYLALPDMAHILLFSLFLVFAYAVSYFLEFMAGICSVWLGETEALEHLYFLVERVFSGWIAPLAFLPLYLQHIANVLPFRFRGSIPGEIFLMHDTVAIMPELLSGVAWVTAMVLVMAYTWRRVVKKYDGGSM